jgi:hypothetical protein
MCVCALYIPPCQTCCYAKANLLDLSPIREREKLKKREKTLDRHWMRDTFVVLAVLRLIAWTVIKLTRIYFIFL